MSNPEETLRRLAIRVERLVDEVLGDAAASACASHLDSKTYSLVQMGALIAIGAAPPSFMPVVSAAREAGATVDEVVGTLFAAMLPAGVARVVSAAPRIGLAVGYDVSEGLEMLSSEP